MAERRLPPWEEIGYFNQPVVTQVGLNAGSFALAVAANPQRILLVFAAPLWTTQINLALQRGGLSTLVLTQYQSIFYLTEKDHPVLVQSGWWAEAGANTSVIVTEVILRQWPDEE